jgi:ABC-type branched-subunit amino acid transport system substrate-binding protein
MAVSWSGRLPARRVGPARAVVACLAAGATLSLAAAQSAPAGDAAPRRADEIVLGMSTALRGPAADLGNRMLAGVNAALAEVERNGGIRGRHLRLIALDDGYEPDVAGPNVRRLVEKENVLAIVGDVGTPTAVAALPIAVASGTPFYGAFTGAGLLRKDPPDHCVVNYRASYAEETTAMVDALIEHARLAPEQIAFFTQRDAYGDAGFAGGTAALKRHGLKDESRILHARYERNTVAVERALADILVAEPPPRAIIMVGAYQPCAAFVKLARENGVDALFLSVSFVGSMSLLRELGDRGDGVVVTQVVPHFESDLPAVKEYRAAIAAFDPKSQPDFISLEGYLAMRVFCRGLAAIEGVPDRASILRSLEDLGSFDLGLDQPLHLSPTQHQACHRVWPTVIRGGRIVPFEWSELGAKR